MRKTKLLTSLAAFVLVLGLGACETTSEEETTPDESEGTTETTDTDTEETSEGESTSESTPEGGDEGGDGPQLLGSFDFGSNTENGTAIASSDALDEFWTGDEDLYLGLRQYDVVYLGNGNSGAFADVTTLIKFGTSSANGSMQLKFAVGTSISEVVVTAHSWYAVSEEYPTQEPNQLVINDISQDCSVSGTATELTYEITDDFTYLLSFESIGRVTIHSIDIYGTYNPDAVEPITSLTLTADKDELNVGESAHVSVAYEPENAVFDIDTLVWTSNSSAASVERTLTGADIRGEASGEATITATAENGVAGSIGVTVQDVLEESETFVSSELGYSNSDAVTLIDGHQVTITFALGTQSTSSNVPKYYTDGTAIRVYADNTVTFSAKYEEAPISSIVLTCYSNYTGSTLTCTNCTSSVTGTTITLTPAGSGDLVLSPSGTSNNQLRITQFTIYYTLAA